jgi:hypothetical protein
MRAFALSMNFVSLAILEFERHRLEGLITWYYNQWHEQSWPDELSRSNRHGLVETAWPDRMLRQMLGRFRQKRAWRPSSRKRVVNARH